MVYAKGSAIRLRPMIRRIEQTVRFPVARMAPTARNWALTQVRLENSGAKAAKEATISGGRSTAVVSRGDGSSTTVDPGQRPPGSASQLGQSRARETGRDEHRVVRSLGVAHLDLRLGDRHRRRGIDEVPEHVPGLGLLIAPTDPAGQEAIEAAGHES